MLHHFGAEIAHALVGEVGFVFQVRTTGDVHRAARQTFVHRQNKTKTVDAAFVAERQLQGFTQRQTGIFYGVVIVNVKVTLHRDFHAETAVGGNLVQHMVKETDTGVDLAAAFTVQPDLHINLCLFGVAFNVRVAVTFCQLFANLCPAKIVAVVAKPRNAHIFRQRNISDAIPDDIAVGSIHRLLSEITLHQFYFRLTAVALIGWHVRANQYLIEHYALRGQHLHH